MVFINPCDQKSESPWWIINSINKAGRGVTWHVACCVCVCVLLLPMCTQKTPEEDSGVICSCCFTKTFYFSVNHSCAVMSHVPYGRICVCHSDWHSHLDNLSESGDITRDMATGQPAALLVLFLCGTAFCLVRCLFHSWNYDMRKPDNWNTSIHTLFLFTHSPQEKCLVGNFRQ